MQVQIVPLSEMHQAWVVHKVGATKVRCYGSIYEIQGLDGYVGIVDDRPVAFALFAVNSEKKSLDVVLWWVPKGFADMIGWLCSALERSAKRAGVETMRTVLGNPVPDLLSAFRKAGFRVAALYPAISEKRDAPGEVAREMWDLEKPLAYRTR